MKKRVVDTRSRIDNDGNVLPGPFISDIELTSDEVAQRKTDRDTLAVPPENTSTRIDDIERALITKSLIVAADIAEAKRNRP